MKKRFSLLLALTMAVSLAACGPAAQQSQPPQGETAAPASSAPAPSPTEEAPPSPSPSPTPEAERPWAWPVGSPEEQGVDPAALEAVHREFDGFPLLGAKIVRNGVLIDTYYKDGYDDSSVFLLHSTSKSITSTLVGIAIDQGYIGGVDEPISQYLPEAAQLEDPAWQQITIRHLLTHTSGIASTDSARWEQWRSSDDWLGYILALPVQHAPGTVFDYSTGNTHLLCVILERATGMALGDFASQVLFGPMGLDSARVDTDPQGIGDGGNGIWLSLSDMAKFGQMYLDGGVWQGEQIVSSGWVDQATSLQFDRSSGSADYGYQWWVRTFGQARYDAYFAQGHFGQYIFVVPALELVVCFTSQYEGSSSIYWQLMNEIVAACGETA